VTLEACAEIVRRGDPDRFLAAMAAPALARKVLFPLYAFNVEVSRAPWMTAEPLIAEMRLQWWRDALDEIAEDRPVRRHEVATPLAEVLDPQAARFLDGLVAARRLDIERAPLAEGTALTAYLDATGGNLAWVGARALGARREGAVRDVAWAGALANYLRAVPQLAAHGRAPLPASAAPVALAGEGLARLQRGRSGVEAAAVPALLWAWQAEAVLRRARERPEAVAEGTLELSEFRRRLSLMWAAATGRV
jgi:phytoene/squalene synthetase